ncbi:MAG: alcohol dehydrogenase catalytic domain-containing protein [Chloroflexota bacterium]
MRAARLYGPKDIRMDEIAEPSSPGTGEVIVTIGAVGVCGSDLHTFEDGRIGNTGVESPLILGHEFGGTVVEVGEDARDGEGNPLTAGTRVAIDPATPCWYCEMCERGDPNLCLNLTFFGLYPHDGALQDRMKVPARNCFPIPDSISDAGAALLETLGVAIHAVDLSKLTVTDDVSIFGCGPVGLLIARLVRLHTAGNIYVFDKHPWRVQKACEWGANYGWTLDDGDPGELVRQATGGRGVDVAIEAAWADQSVNMAADTLRLGGRLVLVGIPGDDTLTLTHSLARRKGLTMMMSRRMKNVYPRAIKLAENGHVDLDNMVSHHFPLEGVPDALDINLKYAEGVQKIVIDVTQ